MVNMFVTGERSTKMLLHYPPVFSDFLAIRKDDDFVVPCRFTLWLKAKLSKLLKMHMGEARSGTVTCGGGSVFGNIKLLVAVFALFCYAFLFPQMIRRCVFFGTRLRATNLHVIPADAWDKHFLTNGTCCIHNSIITLIAIAYNISRKGK